jgi:hypothetical protein
MPIRFFGLEQLEGAFSFAEEGGIAVHVERRLPFAVRRQGTVDGRIYRVVAQRERLLEWGRSRAYLIWDRALRAIDGEAGLCEFFAAGATARRLEAELHITATSSPLGADA